MGAGCRHAPRQRRVAVDHGGAVHLAGFSASVKVPREVWAGATGWQDAVLAGVLEPATHVAWESGRPMIGSLFDSWIDEANYLGERGVEPAFFAHGSDVRVPSQHAANVPASPFHDASAELTQALEKQTVALHTQLADFAGARFVSTPDPLGVVDGSVWCPVVVGVAPGTGERPGTDSGLVVVYASTVHTLKGIGAVTEELAPLAGDGTIDLRRASGMRRPGVLALMSIADVFLDQFALGSYGAAAAEAMAAGCVVVGHITEDVRATVKSATRLELPIVEATRATVANVVRDLAADPDSRARYRAASREFAATVHTGEFSANAMASYIGSRP